jgi:hypothetical protein
MALTTAYLTQVGNLNAILEAIREAQAPDKFTTRFLEQLDFKSTNDRLAIGVLKGLGFLEDSGTPTQRYFDYLDETQHRMVMGQAIQEAYADLFKVNNKANEMSQADVKAKLKTLTQGAKGDAVLTKMTATFAALCKVADFPSAATKKAAEDKPVDKPVDKLEDKKPAGVHHEDKQRAMSLSYAINIELPTTRDQGVYDAIFRSLREHIL